MMKRNILLCLVMVAVFAASCSRSDNFSSSENGAQKVFRISVENYADTLPDTKVNNGIDQLTAAIYNAKGGQVRNVAVSQSSDLSELNVEGLPIGSYTLVLMGFGQQNSQTTIAPPKTIDGSWLPELNGAAQDNEYLYARSEFMINDHQNVAQDITLSRIVGRVDISPIYASGQGSNGMIKSVYLTFEDGATYSTHKAGGDYGGSSKIVDYELTSIFSFYCLPTIGDAKKSCKVTIVSELSDGQTKSKTYEFSLKIEANKRAVLSPKVDVQDDQFGTIRIYDNDRTAQNSLIFFQDGDSYKATCSRRFNPNKALVFNAKGSSKVVASFYSVLPAKDITVWVKRPSDSEYFELAWIETMLALEDRTIEITTKPNRLYRTKSGGVMMIDRINYATLSYKYESSDPLIQKLATITWPIHVGFQPPTADTVNNTGRYLPLRPVHARELVAMFVNMGYTVSQKKWRDAIIAQDNGAGFTNDNKGSKVSYVNTVEPRMWNPDYSPNQVSASVLHPSHPDNGWGLWGMAFIGVGDLYSLKQECYIDHYAAEFPITTSYHEYAHTMGYGHDGNMTYGAWQDICQGKHKELIPEQPFPDISVLNSRANPNLYK